MVIPLGLISLLLLSSTRVHGNTSSEGVELPSDCEVCKFLALELTAALEDSGKTHATLETAKGKVTKYKDSELRLLETLEGLCDRFGEYSLHKEKTGSARFGRGRSQTMETLHALVDKGVKVDLGIPYELWDSPSVEVSELKSRCEWALGDLEEDIEEWFAGGQKEELIEYLCTDRMLKGRDQSCLAESQETQISSDDKPSTTKDSKRGDAGEL